MAARWEIINFALSHLGSKLYTQMQIDQGVVAGSLPQGSSQVPAIRQANLWYNQSKNEVLSAYPWTFATVRKALTPKTLNSTQAPSYDGDWSDVYFYPCDCIQMQYLVDESVVSPTELITNVPYAVEANPDYPTASTEESRLILCNVAEPNASAVFTTSNIADPDLPAHFVQPLSILLAANISFAVTSDLELKASLIRLYAGSLAAYTAQDANQIHNKMPQESQAIRARYGTG